jgi:lysophospholipase L1-like esterase
MGTTTATLRIGSFLFIIFSMLFADQLQAQSTKWISTWSTAPYAADNNTPPVPLANNTLRQIVRVSIGGDTVRVKFSNRTSPTSTTLNAVHIAVSTDSSTSLIDGGTITPLTFSGNASVTMDAYAEVTSDPVAFDLQPGEHIAITIYYGDIETNGSMTFHYGSRTDSYILTGDQSATVDFTGATTVERWYTLSTLEVVAPEKAGAVAVLGNSITDGYGIHDGRNKWPDTFSERLLADSATSHVSVLNLGIGATWLSTSGVSRFESDVLAQEGLRWVIVFYGVNDIGGGASSETVITAFRSLIAQAHAQNTRIYGATITPFNGNSYYSTGREAIRQEVNEWIRTSGEFDAVVDFDAAIRDPENPIRMQEQYSNDWLHPNIAGYNFLGESVPLDLFLGADTTFAQPSYSSFFFEPECATIGENWNVVEDAAASSGRYVTVQPGTESLNSAPADSAGRIHLSFSVDTAGTYTIYGRMNNPTFDDDSFWIKVDDSDFTLYNGMVTSGWQWVSLGSYDLEVGEHHLTIGYREDGATLDKIAVSNALVPPSGMGDEALNNCEATTSELMQELPDGIQLNQNYPNPFNPSTVISYQLAVNSTVRLGVFDAIGRQVAELDEGIRLAGSYQLTFDATHLSSGLYFYRLETDAGFSELRKMLLLK